MVRRKDDESVSISEDCGDELRIRLVRKVHLARYDILGLYEDLKRQYNAILELASSLTENRARLVNELIGLCMLPMCICCWCTVPVTCSVSHIHLR